MAESSRVGRYLIKANLCGMMVGCCFTGLTDTLQMANRQIHREVSGRFCSVLQVHERASQMTRLAFQ